MHPEDHDRGLIMYAVRTREKRIAGFSFGVWRDLAQRDKVAMMR